MPCLSSKAEHSRAQPVSGAPGVGWAAAPALPQPLSTGGLPGRGEAQNPWLLKHWGHSLESVCAHGIDLLAPRLIALQEDGDSSVASLDSYFISNH